MNNREIVASVKLLGDLLELHDENPFKVRAIRNAYNSLKKVVEPLNAMSAEMLTAIPGVGKTSADIVLELAEKGSVKELTDLLSITPAGVVEMFHIKGVGPKKIAQFWRSMGLMSVGELVYYCSENRLKDAKGFGEKSQADILERAMLYLNSKGKLLYANAEPLIHTFMATLNENENILRFSLTGAALRKAQIIEEVEIIVDAEEWPPMIEGLEITLIEDDYIKGVFLESLHITMILTESDVVKEAFLSSFTDSVLVNELWKDAVIPEGCADEQMLFERMQQPYIVPEVRWDTELCKMDSSKLIYYEDIKGVIHNHSVYSDGIHTLEEMCEFCVQHGFDYFAISDHSRSAFYANGLQIESILQQHREIDSIRALFPNFTILRSIESDILGDGSLDYPEDILATFDFVIGSIHSGLSMDVTKATERLIKAIENPYMHMLGHSSGRLLLARAGYPLDYEKIFDACAANRVAIELNANPQRLDLDYSLIHRAIEKGIYISINPDAHSKQGILDIKYGVIAARSGGLTKEMTLNAKPVDEFLKILKAK